MKNLKKWMACILAVTMVLSLVPSSAFEDSVHEHSAACYDESGAQICTDDNVDESFEAEDSGDALAYLNGDIGESVSDSEEQVKLMEAELVSEEAPISTGKAGNNVYYDIYDDGNGGYRLVIRGTGDMYTTYTQSGKWPWYGSRAKITSVEIQQGVTSVGVAAFSEYTNLKKVTIADSVTSIGNYAFNRCSALDEVNIGKGVRTIGSYVFYYCSKLTEISLSDRVTTIGSYAFARTGLKKVYLGNSLTSLSSYVFQYCSSIEELVLPDTVTKLGNDALYSCSRLTDLTLGKGLTTIGSSAFTSTNVKNLKINSQNLSLPDAAIASYLLRYVNTLSFGPDVDVITESMADAINSYCNIYSSPVFEGPNYFTLEKDLDSVGVNGLPAGDYYVDEQGIVYALYSDESAGTKHAGIAYVPNGISELVIPGNTGSEGEYPVTDIQPKAATSDKSLTSVTFENPAQITSIGIGAFNSCTRLATVQGETSVSGVKEQLKNADIGTLAFYKTLLTESEPAGDVSSPNMFTVNKCYEGSTEPYIQVTVDVQKSKVHEPDSENDALLFYTGESAITTVTITNPDSSDYEKDMIVRVYLSFDAQKGKMNDWIMGEHTIVSDGGKTYTFNLRKTSSGLYYLDIPRPSQGDTLSMSFGTDYPSISSPGGGLIIWTDVLTSEEAEAGITKTPPISSETPVIKLSWDTKADKFPLTKKIINNANITLVADGTEDGYVSPNGLNYSVPFTRSGDTLESLGKDHMKYAEIVDQMTLPAPFEWNSEMIAQIKAGNWKMGSQYLLYVLMDGEWKKAVEFGFCNGNTTDFAFDFDEDGNLLIKYNHVNKNYMKSEVSYNASGVIKIEPWMIVAKSTDLTAGESYEFTNTATITEHFMYSEDQVYTASVSKSAKAGAASLSLVKKTEKGQSSDSSNVNGYCYMGADNLFTLQIKNSGILPAGIDSLSDPLPIEMYIRPSNIQSMFDAATDSNLELTMNYATLRYESDAGTVIGTDGASKKLNDQTTWRGSAHSGTASVVPESSCTTGHKIVFSKSVDDGIIYMSVDDSAAAAVTDISAALSALNFVVTHDTEYSVLWTYPETTVVYGGATREELIPATIKDSFMMLTSDDYHNYQNTSSFSSTFNKSARNTATLTADGTVKTAASNNRIRRDFNINKSVAVNGKTPTQDTVIVENDILTYSLEVKHPGGGNYDEIPLVDHMTGAQLILAPKDENKDKDWASGCDSYVNKGREYLILGKGEYTDVNIGGRKADRVIVTDNGSGSGFDTLIFWYLSDIKGADSATTANDISFSFDALVSAQRTGIAEMTYTADNEVWLGDYEGHRLYDTVGVGLSGSVVEFEKKIVDETSSNKNLVFGNLQDWDYTGRYGGIAGYDADTIEEGETVVYRLRFMNKSESQDMTLTDTMVWDYLPIGSDLFRWSKENITMNYSGFKSVSDESDAGWYITDPDKGYQQIITWNPGFSMIIEAGKTADIYVTVKFPENTEDKTSWDNYAAKHSSDTILNTLKVMNLKDSVRHTLFIQAEALLQKGVFSSGYMNGSFYLFDYSDEDSRYHYTNKSSSNRDSGTSTVYNGYVNYYAVLYNDGNTNLYIEPLQDVLPKGFTFFAVTGTTYKQSSTSLTLSRFTSTSTDLTNASFAKITDDSGRTPSFVKAHVDTKTETKDGVQTVTFELSGGNLSYDEITGKYYLKPGQQVQFLYCCKTNEYDNSDDEALNSISMPYYDYTGAGVKTGKSKIQAYSPSGDTYNGNTALWLKNAIPNDGGCEIIDEGTAESMGLSKMSNTTQWLTSDVTVTRENITPGITKVASKTTDINGNVTSTNPTTASPEEKISWTVTLYNDSMSQIREYAITDIMESPYVFSGTVSLSRKNDSSTSSFRITSRGTDPDGREYVTVLGNYGKSTGKEGEQKLYLGDDDPVYITTMYNANLNKYAQIGVKFSKNANGDEVMTLYCPTDLAISPTSPVTMTVVTENPTSAYENKTYKNSVYLTPLTQSWDHAVSKGNYTTLNVDNDHKGMDSVRSSAQIVVTSGYMTSSVKTIREVDDPSNAATCFDDRNFIAIDDVSKEFIYTLQVDNITNRAMDELVIIDSLPEENDHSVFNTDDARESDFKVSLSQTPDFKMGVVNSNGSSKTVDPDKYTVQLSRKTTFDVSDWSGNDSEDWVTYTQGMDTSGYRSVRMVFHDEAGTIIPAEASVYYQFKAHIDDETAAPAEIAWNSFGYQYSLYGIAASLEAAPLKVGVLIPGIPSLNKSLEMDTGISRKSKEDTVYRFLIYEGSALGLNRAKTEQEMWEILKNASRNVTLAELTVKSGETVSDSISMDNLRTYSYSEETGWTPVDNSSWNWTYGNKYSIYEIRGTSESFSKIDIDSFESAVKNNEYTFTYNDIMNSQIECTNVLDIWELVIQKNGKDGALKGAVFGLYTSEKADMLSERECGDYQSEIENDGTKYYLSAIETSDSDGRISFNALTENAYVLKELKAPKGYKLDTDVSLIERPEDSNRQLITVTNTYKPAAVDVVIKAKKNLDGRAVGDREFEFVLKNGNDTVQSKSNDENGNVEFNKISIDEEGTYHYTISEKHPDNAEYDAEKGVWTCGEMSYDAKTVDVKVVVTDVNGELVSSVTYDDSATIPEFNNTYSPSAEAEIILNKEFNVESGDSSIELEKDQFTFDLVETDENGDQVENAYTDSANNDEDGSIAFDPISYSAADEGEHYYKITERIPNDATDDNDYTVKGIEYDTDAHIVKVDVTKNEDGSLTAAVDSSTTDFSFNNRYTAKGSIKITGTKTLTGRTLNEGEFEFSIEELTNGILNTGILKTKKDDGFEETVSNGIATVNSDGSSAADFGFEIEYTKVGTYYYSITEIDGGLGGVTYDTKEINIAVEVTDNKDGTLSAGIASDESDEISFENSYSSNGSVELGAKKDLRNKSIEKNTYYFNLAPKADDTTAHPSGLTNETQRVCADENGDITFDSIGGFNGDDIGKTFTYTIQEEIPEGAEELKDESGQGTGVFVKDGVKYDSDIEEVKVTVTRDNLDGTLTITPDRTKDDLVFTNVYSAKGTLSVTANKIFNVGTSDESYTLQNGMFSFVLEESDENGTSLEGGYSDTAVNSADGGIAFDTINYGLSDVGTHYYTIRETHGGETVNSVEYDPAVYLVKAVVSDNKNGKLGVKKTLFSQVINGEEMTWAELNENDAVEFENNYSASGTITLGGEKKFEKSLSGGEFSFSIERVDSADPETAAAVTGDEAYFETVTNKADKGFTFSEITYGSVGTYYYIVKEVLPDGVETVTDEEGNVSYEYNGIRYDTGSQMITVTVTDDDRDGNLVAEADKTSAEVTFENVTLGNLVITKAFTGTAITDEDRNKVEFTVTGPAEAGEKASEWSFTYADMTEGVYVIQGLVKGTYKVSEANTDVSNYIVETSFETSADPDSGAVKTDSIDAMIEGGDTVTVSVTNEYSKLHSGGSHKPSDSGSDNNPPDSGNGDDPSDSGNGDNPSDSGNGDNPSNSGNIDNPSDSGGNSGSQNNSGTSGKNSNTSKKKGSISANRNPKTGDDSHVEIWAISLLLSAACIAVCIIAAARRRKQK